MAANHPQMSTALKNIADLNAVYLQHQRESLKAAEEDTRNAWEKLPKPAMAQVVIVLSFTTIISLMLATFWVVVQVRSIPDRVAYAQTESALFLSTRSLFTFSSSFTTRR